LPPLVKQVADLVANFPAFRDRVEQHLPHDDAVLRQIVDQIFLLPSSPDVAAEVNKPLIWGRMAVAGIMTTGFVLITTLYLLDGKRLYAWLLAYVPRAHREKMAETLPAVAKVVYASAGCTVAEKTFDGAAATLEDSPVSLWLDSPYQISKIVGELYANYYHRRHGLPVVKARFQNVYGPGEVLGAGRWRGTVNTVWRNVTPTFIYKALHQEALPVESGGLATRDFIYVDDIVEGLVACALRGSDGGVYNLASGVETPILELAERVNELTANPTPIALAPARDWDRSGKRFGSTGKSSAGEEKTKSRERSWAGSGTTSDLSQLSTAPNVMPRLTSLPAS